MLSTRARLSLVQFIALQPVDVCNVLLKKYGESFCCDYQGNLLTELHQTFEYIEDDRCLSILRECVGTKNDLRSRISPKNKFDERWNDLRQCLLLDGYLVEDDQLSTIDPTIGDTSPIDDDLIKALKTSELPDAAEIISRIQRSTDAFRSSPPDYNACLNGMRVALETLARTIAISTFGQNAPHRWGELLSFLKSNQFISVEHERGLAGVYHFLSPGSHRNIGIPEDQMVRLGRSFSLNMCWFLLEKFRSAD
ncbi:MAG: hypothetical protein KTR23_17495 [Rhodospirillales bacterium]|nr:hypothetical protein [Rhodospirillales bacterium]